MSILKREILYPGKSELGELEPDTKLLYHFETVVISNQNTEPLVIDDSRRMASGQPVETIYGKKFKLPIWESCLSSMRKGEICRLTVRDDPHTHYICLNYVATSKCFRKHYGIEPTKSDFNEHEGSMNSTHSCSMSLGNSPYTDLNDMIKNPPEIFRFTFELVDALPPQSYTKDIWQMSDEEKLDMLPKYREEGNRHYTDLNYDAAVSAYAKGLTILESLMLKERPKDADWNHLDEMKIPFFLNLSQVKLAQCEYYDCIRHTDEVLKRDPENVKALFRRAKAHIGVWNLAEAKDDFRRCLECDRTMAKAVSKCLQDIKARELMKNEEDRERCVRMFNKN